MAEAICMNCGRGEWKHCGDAGCKNFVPWPDRPVNKLRIAEKKPLPVNVLVGSDAALRMAESNWDELKAEQRAMTASLTSIDGSGDANG